MTSSSTPTSREALSPEQQRALTEIAKGLAAAEHYLVLTGAGISADSGLPVYRDHQRQWQHSQPMQYQDFMRSAAHRQRYWMGSFLGWPRFSQARPNSAHQRLADWSQAGQTINIVTQNVDGLHQQAGSEAVVDLHGRLDRIRCLDCGQMYARESIQQALVARYGDPDHHVKQIRPDGDAISGVELAQIFAAPDCSQCHGVLKPDVVFFGENIPKAWKQQADVWLDQADTLLVIGSSLSVFSGYYFAREAARQNKHVYCINIGETRADALFNAKLNLSAVDSLRLLDQYWR